QMLARLGKIATERGLDLLDVHYVQSERNKPALDFLDAVGGGHRQALNGGYVYRFPAAEACQVRFEPERNCPPAQPARPMPTVVAAGQAKLGASLARFPQCRTIALEAYDAVRIHARMEARLAHRVQGKRAGYVAPRTELERKLCEVWQRLLRVERVGVQENFFDLGGHSLLAVRLFAEIERLTGRKLPLVTLFQAATIEELNRVLSQDTPVESESLLVPIQPRGSRPPLILVHGAGGDVLWGYANLAAALGSEQPIYGLKSRGQVGREEFTRIQEMAACYLEQVRSFQPRGPYYLGGYCFGGNVAFEMARQLVQQGEKVAFLALLDSSPSNAGYEQIRWWSPRYAIRFSRNLGYWLKDFMALKAEERRTYFVRKARAFARKLKPGSANAVDLEEVIDLSHFSANELRLWQIHLQALVEHVDQPYEGDVVLLRTRGQPLFCSLEPDFCWSKLVRGKLEVKMVPGSHENVFMEPNVQALAAEIDGCLEQIRKGHTAAFHSQSAFVTT
ncbi:MAG TPA: alpha/beta fold hydrolase, partial [Clostridia bacterium]|nr:alpha/beta fold hydrolase [Clostridia bacterium]